MEITSAILIIIVALLWGITNPMMKKGSEGIENCKGTNPITTFLQELKFLLMNWKYLLAYLINQCGSLLYYYTLGQVEMSIAGPLTNTLTFVITYLSGILLFGEKDENPTIEKKLGLFLVCSGVVLCVVDKL